MNAVINTSALSSFMRAKAIDLLKMLFDEIIIPEGVLEELSKRYKPPSYPWITIYSLNHRQIRRALALGLGKGESQAIIVAKDLKTYLIIDEKSARKVAKKYSIKVIGTAGILKKIYEECLIDQERWRQIVSTIIEDQYWSPEIRRYVLSARKKN